VFVTCSGRLQMTLDPKRHSREHRLGDAMQTTYSTQRSRGVERSISAKYRCMLRRARRKQTAMHQPRTTDFSRDYVADFSKRVGRE